MECTVAVPWVIPDCNAKSHTLHADETTTPASTGAPASRNGPPTPEKFFIGVSAMSPTASWTLPMLGSIANTSLRPSVMRAMDLRMGIPFARTVENARNETQIRSQDITVASVRTAGREIIANCKSIRIIRRHQSWSEKSATSFPEIKLFGLLYSQSWAFLRSFTFEDIISLNSEEKDPTDVIAVEKIRKWLLLVMTHEILFRSECWTKQIGEK